MQKLTSGSKQSRAAVLLPLAGRLPFLFDTRSAAISKMSGFPVSRHALARLQRMIKVGSLGELLNSIVNLSELAYLTAEIIESMDATNLNKYQINRMDVATYVANLTASSKSTKLSEEEIDIVAHLITSSEANPNSWTLSGGDQDDNLHLSFYDLYKEILLTGEPAKLSVYSPSTGTVVNFNQLPMFKRAANAKNADVDKNAERMNSHATIYQYAACRIVDHVYQALMDKDIWGHFLSPRKTADVTSNLDRAKSLRVFSLYLQSLLTYNQFFSLEMYMQAYDTLQKWLVAFPSLETETMNKIEGSIRKHDYLGARHDAASLFSSFSSDAQSDLGALVFPREYVGAFGFAKKVDQIEEQVRAIQPPATLTELPILDDPKFLPITSGGIVSKFDIVYDLADLLIREKVVAAVIDEALKGLIPSLTRGNSKMALSALEALNLKCTIPFVIPTAVSYEVVKGVERGIRGGKLVTDLAAAPYCYTYHKALREDFKFRMMFDRGMASIYEKFKTSYIVDFDRASHLRGQLEYDWKSFTPAFMASGDRAYSEPSWLQDADAIREFVEYVTGINYEIVIRQMSVSEMRMIWATFTSAFCTTYYRPGDNRSLRDTLKDYKPGVDNAGLQLVLGYGKPYGTSYATLAAAQGALTLETKLIPLGWGLYIRIITKMPTPTEKLAFDSTSFYNQHPFGFYASSSEHIAVKEWVKEEGLWHHALTPLHGIVQVPAVKFTPKHAFANAQMFLNVDLFYKPSAPEPGRESVAINLVEEEWPFDRFQYWTKYIHFGRYGSPSSGNPALEDSQLLADTIKKVENAITEDSRAAAASAESAGTAMKNVAKKAADETAAGLDTRTAKDLAADEETPVV